MSAHRQAFEHALAFMRKKFDADSERGRKALKERDYETNRRCWDRSHELGGLIGALNSLMNIADRAAAEGKDMTLDYWIPKDDDLLVIEAENQKLREQLTTLTRAVQGECSKFRFPDEDRPELYAALKEIGAVE